MLCGPDKQSGRSNKTDAMLSFFFENVSENTGSIVKLADAMHIDRNNKNSVWWQIYDNQYVRKLL